MTPAPAAQPTGTVALVFTDIQGSTEAWERLGERYHDVIAQHNRVMRDAIASCAGHEVKTEGDAFMVAFATASNAIRFTLDAQAALEAVTTPDDGQAVRVRMGVHVGEPICEADPVTGRMDYFGPMVNRSARIASAAHGGQTLISASAREAAAGALEHARVKDLGKHRLKGLERLEQLFELVPASVDERLFPPIRTLTALPTNLPSQPTSFIGRRREVRDLAELVTLDDARLVTLTGPGGIGKTRLSIRVGGEVLDRFEGGVWFVELEHATTADAVASAVASAMGVPIGTKGPVEAVASALEVRGPTLLVLDNFEQVAAAAPETVGLWLSRAPKTTMLVSSRELLGVRGEREYELRPLADPRGTGTAFSEHDAVRLFVDRAKAASSKFELTETNAPDIAEICAQLDGIPLAIELAAARAKIMKPAQIRQRLAKRFQLLRSSARDLPGRQQTLAGAIDWSYELLSDWERSAFCQACVFRGGFTLEAAEAIIDLFDYDKAPMAMDAAQRLREKSLLTYVEPGDEAEEGRFGMYVSIRDYGRIKSDEVLGEDGREPLIERHLEFYLAHAEEWEDARRTGSFREALDRLEADAENILIAHERALERDRVDEAARLVLALSATMALRGVSGRRGEALSRTLEALTEEADAGVLVDVLCAMAMKQIDAGEWADAKETAASATAAAREAADGARLGNALIKRAEVERLKGEPEAAQRDFREARDVLAHAGETAGVARASSGLGSVAWQSGRYAEAIGHFEAALRMFEEIGSEAGAARCHGGIAIVLGERGEHEAALESIDRAEAIYRALGDRVGLARSLGNKGIELRELDRLDDALACLAEAESLNRQLGLKASLSRNLGSRAMLLEKRGQHEEALAAYARGEDVQLAMGDMPGIALFRTRRGRSLVAMDRLDEARAALEEAIAVLEAVERDHSAVTCEARGWLAAVLVRSGEHDAASEHAQHAEALRAELKLGDDVYGSDAIARVVAELSAGD
jgi:predicted ATPase/class 3 adenylate cyclase